MSVSVFSTRSAAPATVRGAALPAIFARLRGWAELARQRRALARLDNERLADLGLEAGEARAEAARPFWDAPVGWR
jgi:uncharacterized protein YjiS (DUF1127 family)